LPNWVGINAGFSASGDTIGVVSQDRVHPSDADPAAEGNLISGNEFGVAYDGGAVPSETNGLVAGNLIGTNASGTAALSGTGLLGGSPVSFTGNFKVGVGAAEVASSCTIGGPSAALANTIAYNGGDGVWIVNLLNQGNPTGIRIEGNSIHDNAALGIALGGSFPFPATAPNSNASNDAAGHAGPNNLENFPVLNAAASNGSYTGIVGTFSQASQAGKTITLDFYANANSAHLQSDGNYYGEGQTWLGSATVTTDGNGNAAVAVDLPTGNLVGQWISATATDAGGDTSEFSADVQVATTSPYVVSTTADSGPGSLREAINQINADTVHGLYTSPTDPTRDEIDFNIPTTDPGYSASAGTFTIQPASPLPVVTNQVIINGTTQPGWSPNTLAVGDNAKPVVVLRGTMSSGNESSPWWNAVGLTLSGGNSSLEGLVVNGFDSYSVLLDSSGDVVQGNFIGTDATATHLISQGVAILGGQGNLIGTAGTGLSDAGERNILGGVVIAGGTGGTGGTVSSANVVAGNYVGVDATGSAATARGSFGVVVEGNANTIGGTAALAGNVISGQLFIADFGGNVVQGNSIGTDVTGTRDFGNTGGAGVELFGSSNNTIGGAVNGAGNTIAFNEWAVLVVTGNDYPMLPAEGNLIQGNSIFSSTRLGIAFATYTTPYGSGLGGLFEPGVTLGALPILESATASAGLTTVTGSWQGTPNSTFTIDLYDSPSVGSGVEEIAGSGSTLGIYGEGRHWLGSTQVTTDGTGHANFTYAFATDAGQPFVTATVTDSTNTTSEFSAALRVNDQPPNAVARLDPAVYGSAPPTQFKEGAAVYFDASGSTDPDGDKLYDPYSYTWNFGDGTTSNSAKVSHTYSEENTGGAPYTVTLTVTDLVGATSTTTMLVPVVEVPPSPTITSGLATDAAGYPAGLAGAPISLGSSVGDVSPADLAAGFKNYTWSVAGGPYTVQPTAEPTTFDFTPEYSGQYVVTLSVSDQGGAVGTTSQIFDVVPVVNISPTSPALFQGQPDPTFGTSGIHLGSLGTPDDEATDVFALPDGKLLVVGLTQNLPNGAYSLTLSRYQANGSLDPSYGTGGTVVTGLTTANYFYPLPANQFVCQPDGSLVVLWATKDASGNVLSTQLARFRSDGSLDTAFGAAATGAISGFSANVIAAQIDGKTLIGGSIVVGTDVNGNAIIDSVVERLNADGSPDATFGPAGTGKVIQDLGLHEEVTHAWLALDQSFPYSLAVQPDGSILVGGYVNSPSAFDVLNAGFVARFLADGTLDASFGHRGEVVLVDSWGDDPTAVGPAAVPFNRRFVEDLTITRLTLQPNGQILAGMDSVGNGSLLLRLNPDGSLDPNFAQLYGSGVSLPGGFARWGVDAAGRILVIIPFTPPQDSGGFHEFAVIRYNSDGSPDLSFGANGTGTASIDVTGADSYAQGLAVQSDGNIVLAGTQSTDNGHTWQIELMRLIGQPAPAHGTPGVPVTLYPALPQVGGQAETFAYTWSVTKNGAAFSSSSSAALTTVPSFTFTPDTSGTYVATLTVTDAAGASSAASATFLVASPPTTGTTPNQVNLPLSAWDSSPASQQAGFTYAINWGDGPPLAPDLQTIPQAAGNGSGTIASHTFTSSGSYDVTVTATDQYGFSQSTSDVIVVGTAGADALAFSGGPNLGDVQVNLNGVSQTFCPTGQVFATGLGGGDTYTVNFGSSLTTPIILAGGGSSSGDSLIVNGDGSSTNVITKTGGQVTWGNVVTETVFPSGIPSTTINANGTTSNYVTDPGANTTINGGPGANFVTITASSGNGVVIHGGSSTNSYVVDLGSLAGPVSISNSHAGASDTLTVNGAPGDNTLAIGGAQVTEGTQSITDTAPLTNLTVNGGSGKNQFTVSALSVPVQSLTLNGGGTSNTFILNNVGNSVQSLTINGGSSPAGTTQVRVQGALPASVTAQNASPIVIAPTAATLNEGGTFIGSGSFIEPNAGQTFTATVDYGDGSGPQPLTLAANDTFMLNHVYSDEGTYPVTVSVTGSTDGTGTASFTSTVSAVPPTVSITGAPATGPEGTTITLGSTVTSPSSVDTAAGFADSWSVTKDGNPFASGSGAGFSFTPDDDATYVVTLTATDDGGNSVSASKTITVTNVPPTASLGGPADGYHGVDGQTRTFSIGAIDPSTVDQAAGFTYLINWGDGTPSAPDIQTIAASAKNGTGLTVGHVFPAAGLYAVAVTATDQDGATGPPATLVANILAFEQQGTTLAVGGRAGADAYVLSPGSASGTVIVKDNGTSLGTFTTALVQVYGGGGTNTITVNGLTTGTAFTIGSSAVSIPGVSISGNGVSAWAVNGVGGTNTFAINGSGLHAALTGGPKADTFTVAAGVTFDGSIRGGTGTETLVGQSLSTGGSTWQLTGANAGTLNGAPFTGIANLTGGAGSDSFQFGVSGSLSGKIVGGGGSDWLDYSAWTTGVTVDLTRGKATAVAGGVSGILNVRGGAGTDTLTGGGGNILIGGGGKNTLTDAYAGSAASGRSLLIAGSGGSNIQSGAAGDILIGGTTSYDNNNAALAAILAEWQSGDDYNTRFNRLEGLQSGGLNGAYDLIWGSTVLDNSASDKLIGSPTGLDWFFAQLSGNNLDKILNLNKPSHEHVNNTL
jgi:uncharacterized delta-60 repeat protein